MSAPNHPIDSSDRHAPTHAEDAWSSADVLKQLVAMRRQQDLGTVGTALDGVAAGEADAVTRTQFPPVIPSQPNRPPQPDPLLDFKRDRRPL